MGFLESIKRTLNIAGADVMVATDDDVYSQFDRVAGEVLIKGGDYEHSGEAIEVTLKEFWTETRSTGKTVTTVTVFDVHQTVTLTGSFSIRPWEEQRYPFAVQLPINCRISTKDTGWTLVVTLKVPGAIDPTGRFDLDVRPAEEFLAIVQTCEAGMRFEEESRFRRWKRETGETLFRLVPPDVLKPKLDYLRLELSQTEERSVVGSLIIDLQERSIADYFRAIVNRDQVKISLRFTYDQIFLPDGEPNVEAITQSISHDLQRILTERF